jgi:CRP-like cAMP-binding protein
MIPGDADATRATLLETQTKFLAATDRLTALLDQTRSEIERGRHHIEQGGNAAALPDVAGTPTVNVALTDALTAFAEARNTARIEMFTMAWHEGLSFEDIAQTWGISRQRVSQIMNAAGRSSIKRARRESET